jgi:hypothetical protein
VGSSEGETIGHERQRLFQKSGECLRVVTISFEARDGSTVQTFHQAPFRNVERRDSHVGGWIEAFDKEQAYAETIAKEHPA